MYSTFSLNYELNKIVYTAFKRTIVKSSTLNYFLCSFQFTACFRRVLAGKRVAPQWVKRTLACERVEDCQFECGEEKRFICEGFNYKLDPTGRGQGICELIDVPLSRLTDVFTSHRHRDENLLRHPDYDYYERDRNACRPTPCKECGSRQPFRPTTSVIGHYQPTTYRPPLDHFSPVPVDRPSYGPYRPPRPPSDSRPSYLDRPSFGSKPPSYDRPNFDYDSYKVHYHSRPEPVRPSYGSEVDRYDRPKPTYHSISSSTSSGGYYPSDNRPSLPPPRPIYHRPSNIPTTLYIESAVFTADDNYRPPSPPPHSPPVTRPSYGSSNHFYLDRPDKYRPFTPYEINNNDSQYPSHHSSSSYGGSYYNRQEEHRWGGGGSSYGGRDDNRRDGPSFNYFELGNRGSPRPYEDNFVWNYPGSGYGSDHSSGSKDSSYYGTSWTRRPGQDGEII